MATSRPRKASSNDAQRPALQQRSQEKRDRLIKAGIRAFARDGYEGARVADIARDAGISVGVFYQRFQDKRGFFTVLEQAFIERATANWDKFYETADPDWTPQEFFEKLIQRISRVIYRNVGFLRALITLAHTDRSVVAPGVELDRYSVMKAEEYLIASGMVKPARLRPDAVYFGLTSVFKVLIMMSLNDAGPYRATDQKTVTELARMLIAYLDIKS